MKMKATLEVEFEADPSPLFRNKKDQLEMALRRAEDALGRIIEYGIADAAVPTGIRRGQSPSTTKVTVVKNEIVDE